MIQHGEPASRPYAALFWFGMAAAALLLFSREPNRLLHPQLYAEDGILWLSQAYTDGAASLLRPVVGYLQTLSRLGALIALPWPLTWTPFIYALLAFIIQLVPAALLFSARGAALIPHPAPRLLLIAFYIGQPNTAEVHVNLTTAMWHLALAGFLLVLLPKPRTAIGVGADSAGLVLCGLSGPLILYIAPLACWRAFAGRRLREFRLRVVYAALTSGCALLQLSLIVAQARHSRQGSLGATPGRLAHIIANQVVIGGTIGAGPTTLLMGQPWWWQHSFAPASLCLAAAGLGLVAFVRGPAAYRLLVVFAALIFVSGLASPMVSFVQPQWYPMQYPGIGTRYYFVAILAWFCTLLVLAARPWAVAGHWVARTLLGACLIGVLADWRIVPYAHPGFDAAATAFEQAAPGTKTVFPVNPSPWTFTLTKR